MKQNLRKRSAYLCVREYTEAMEAKVAEMEAENAALRAQVERELCNNRQLKEDLGIGSDECLWV
jgi:hypothetical protein